MLIVLEDKQDDSPPSLPPGKILEPPLFNCKCSFRVVTEADLVF